MAEARTQIENSMQTEQPGTMVAPPDSDQSGGSSGGSSGGGAATMVRTRTAPPKVDRLPPWKVLLHNDDRNDMLSVVLAIRELTALTTQEAIKRMLEAHTRGLALLLVTHREHAELLQEQFKSKRLTVSVEAE